MDFVKACSEGKLKIAKEIFEGGNIDIHANNEHAFRSACHNGHPKLAKWLIEISTENKLGIINIHACNEYAFRFACFDGHLNIAKWLIDISKKKKLGSIDIHAENEETFCFACFDGHLNIAKWLIEISEEKKEAINIHVNNEKAFRFACRNSHLEVAKWLLTLYSVKELKNLNHFLAEEELENRRKTNIGLILYLYERKFKLLDIHAIAISWKEYL